MRLRPVIAYRLPDLVAAQATDHLRPNHKGNQQRRQHPQDGTQRQVLENVEAAVVLTEIFGEVDKHG